MSVEETEFPVALRGYERGPVDDALLDLRKQVLQLSSQNSQLANELRETNKALDAAREELQEAGKPTYTGVGARAALILSTAEDQAAHLLAEAEREAERKRKGVALEVEAQRGEAKGYYDSLVSEAQRRSDRIIGAARSDYDEIIAKAKQEAARIADEAMREAGSIRGSISTEVAKMRAAARREIASTKAEVERDLAERKLIAFRENSRNLDFNSAASLMTEQARIDLELELTARRSEAEAEYLQKHQEAVSTTQKYLDDANSQLSNALTRANAARLEAETLEAAAISFNQQTTTLSRQKADAIIAAADAEARSIVATAQIAAAREIATATEATVKISAERDSVDVYLKNLRAVLDNAGTPRT